jgi:non-canonical purine NTP pyrophosphatase (RdgB/HAM1 family)
MTYHLENLTLVSGNSGKAEEIGRILGIQLAHEAVELVEIQSLDVIEVVRAKARAAHAQLGRPVLVEDTSLELAALGGFPGPLIKWFLGSVGVEGICQIVDAFDEPAATVRCAAMTWDGEREELGVGVVCGRIASAPRGDGGFGWDSIFIADQACGSTYGELEPAAKDTISHRRAALEALRSNIDNSRRILELVHDLEAAELNTED